MQHNVMRACFTIGASVVLALGLLASNARSETVYELKLATFTPEPGLDSEVLRLYAKEWEAKSSGRLKVKIFYGASMGPMPRHYDLVRTGVADLAYFQHGMTPGRFPLTELLHLPYMVPPGLKGAEVGAMVMADLLEPYLAKEHDGVRVIWLANTRPAFIYDASKEIRTVADLKGRRYRAPTTPISEMLKSLGANPIGIPAPLMAESLQKGTIDGVITDPPGIANFRLGGLVKYKSPMFLAVMTFGLVMNKESYEKLPADLRQIIDAKVGDREQAARNAAVAWGETPALASYLEKASITDVQLEPAADKEMRRLADDFVAQHLTKLQQGQANRLGSEVYGRMRELVAKYSK
jgi:TRAP-type C4-dicarboxylate transport system substrate-binding protein